MSHEIEILRELKAIRSILLRIETELYVLNATNQGIGRMDYLPGTTKDMREKKISEEPNQ